MYKSIDAGFSWKPIPVRLVIPPPPEKQVSEPQRQSNKTSSPHSTARTRAARARVARPVKPKPTIREVSISEVSGLYSRKVGTKNLLFAATDIGLLRSEDAAEHWSLISIPKSTAVTALYFSPKIDALMIAKAANGLFLSADAGDHWSELSFPLPLSDVKDVAVPTSPEERILVATRVGLYSSADQGGKWSSKPEGLPVATINSVLYGGPEQTAYAVEYGRLYKTKDAGASWSEVSTSMPSLHIRQLWMPDQNSERLFAVTSDIGIIFRN